MPRFIGLEADAATMFDQLQIAVIGLGSVGREAAGQIARLGPSTLWLVDPARFKPESLLTHGVVPADLGQSKASSAGQLCKQLSPRTTVRIFEGRFQDVDHWELTEADFVVLATDNLVVEIAVTQFCLRWQRPLLQASVYGEALVAQTRLLLHREAEGPCLGCAYGEQEWEHYRQEAKFSCAGVGEQHDGRPPSEPTRSPAFLCALAANLCVAELARLALVLGKPPTDSLLEYCGYTQTTTRSPLTRRATCPCRHVACETRSVAGCVADYRLSELARAAGALDTRSESDEVDVVVDGHQFVEAAYCCGAIQALRSFVPIGEPAGDCPACGRPRQVLNLFTRPSIALRDALLDDREPLNRRGAATARWVALDSSRRAVVLRGASNVER
jgi:molybdopterin/thiamine biosynthesis adenylyltransferase